VEKNFCNSKTPDFIKVMIFVCHGTTGHTHKTLYGISANIFRVKQYGRKSKMAAKLLFLHLSHLGLPTKAALKRVQN
jgi:hypothetical protein